MGRLLLPPDPSDDFHRIIKVGEDFFEVFLWKLPLGKRWPKAQNIINSEGWRKTHNPNTTTLFSQTQAWKKAQTSKNAENSNVQGTESLFWPHLLTYRGACHSHVTEAPKYSHQVPTSRDWCGFYPPRRPMENLGKQTVIFWPLHST